MNINEAKVGMYICRIGQTNILQITKINQKSITCTYYNIRENELAGYMIVDEIVAKKQTIKTIINDSIRNIESMRYKLQEIGQIIERYKDYIKIDSNKLNTEIEEIITKINNILKKVEEDVR